MSSKAKSSSCDGRLAYWDEASNAANAIVGILHPPPDSFFIIDYGVDSQNTYFSVLPS
jgi:hypothetical protein